MTDEIRIGRVVRQDARVFHVDFGVEGGERDVRPCVPRGRLFEHATGYKSPIAVGDWVRVGLDGDPPGIEAVEPRRNYLARIASSHDPREQVLFANVDQLFCVASIKSPKFSSNRADRILAACRWHDVPATLVLNKIDLDRDEEREFVRETYEHAGIEVIETSATSGAGLEVLRERLTDSVSALYGASGVGKSTLLNALQPGLGLKIGKISRYWESGKHTTTFSQMHLLDFGGWVIDTPGIRVFRLHGATKFDVRGLFPEFESYQSRCHFPDCTHDHEPDCAVFAAVDAGELSPTRYASYVEMLDEVSPPTDVDDVAPPEG